MSNSTYETAQELADHVARYEKRIDEAPLHRSRDLAEHMADPTATSEEFDREYNERMAKLETGLREARNDLAEFERQNHGLLVAVGWFQTDDGLDDCVCPNCFGDAFRRRGSANNFVCAVCQHRFPYAERSIPRITH